MQEVLAVDTICSGAAISHGKRDIQTSAVPRGPHEGMLQISRSPSGPFRGHARQSPAVKKISRSRLEGLFSFILRSVPTTLNHLQA